MDIKGFFGNWIVRNLLGAVIAILLLVAVCAVALNFATHHGQKLSVPDFSNMSVAEASAVAAAAGVRVEVTDSVYVRKMGRGLVFSQNPKAGSGVKTGRRIMLTINSVRPKRVTMPDLVGLSMRQAKAELLSNGLMLGRLLYEDDMATNNVLRQLYRGRPIAAGRKMDSGAEIDLVVGLNAEDNLTFIPDVSGMKYMRAVDAIHENSLNIARLRFDKGTVTFGDSLDAVVYKQTPPPSEDPVRRGSEVTLFLRRAPEDR